MSAPTQAPERIELAISGMTCASCANRIERKLNKLEGVTATVNYATEKAAISAPSDVDTQTLIDEVEKAGYSATLPQPTRTEPQASDSTAAPDAELVGLRQRVIGSAI